MSVEPRSDPAVNRETMPVGAGTWVVVPTYDEVENLRPIVTAILGQLPAATVLVVDDNSPDGTGELADELAAGDARVRACHRPRKEGLGRAYLEGFAVALGEGATSVVQMDADWSHDPAALPGLLAPVEAGDADLVIGSRYTRGGRVTDWGIGRRLVSRGGSTFARIVLGLPANDLTGGFKAWRSSTLASIDFGGIHAGGYVFQIEMTHRARLAGARLVEVPITFRDRRVGASKMSRRIIGEALLVVVRLRWERSVVGRFAASHSRGADGPLPVGAGLDASPPAAVGARGDRPGSSQAAAPETSSRSSRE